MKSHSGAHTAAKPGSPAASMLKSLFDKNNLEGLIKEIDRVSHEPEHGNPILWRLFDHLRHASPFPQSIFQRLTDHPGFAPSLTHALNFLITTNQDVGLIHGLLQKNIRFGELTAVPSRDDVRKLILGARRRKILYAGTTQARTTLDGLLLKLDLDAARTYLASHDINGDHIARTWGRAVADQRLDILRALLMLCYVDGRTTYRSEEKGGISDSRILDVVKGIPYTSPKRRNNNLNGKSRFKTGEGTIWCRHISIDILYKYLRTGNPRFIPTAYADTRTMAKSISYSVQAKGDALVATKSRLHYAGFHAFGDFLSTQFAEIRESQGKTRMFYIMNTTHAMWLVLKEKVRHHKRSYVAHFGDPNLTMTWTRSRHTYPISFKLDRFSDYLMRPSYLIGGKAGAVSIYPFDPGKLADQGIPRQFGDYKFLSATIRPEDYTAEMILKFFRSGYAGLVNQSDVKHFLGKLDRERMQLIATTLIDRRDLFSMALGPKAEKLFAAFKVVFAFFTPEQVLTLFKPPHPGADSPLRLALKHDAVHAIACLAQLFEFLPPEQRKHVALTLNREGRPDLVRAVERHAANTLSAFKAVLATVPATDRRFVLLGNDGGRSACKALRATHGRSGGSQVRKQYAALVKLVPQGEREGLMTEEMFEGSGVGR